MRVALMSENVVQNIIEAESLAAARKLFPSIDVYDVDNIRVGIGWTYENGSWIEPAPQPVEPTRYILSKADMWRRCTDDEADAFQAAFAQTSARVQGIFNGATVIYSDDELFPMLQAGINAALMQIGLNADAAAIRAAEILAPSES